jgi:hypothetical protein
MEKTQKIWGSECIVYNTRYVGAALSQSAWSDVFDVLWYVLYGSIFGENYTETGFLISIACIKTMTFSETVSALWIIRTRYEFMSRGFGECYHVYYPNLFSKFDELTYRGATHKEINEVHTKFW